MTPLFDPSRSGLLGILSHISQVLKVKEHNTSHCISMAVLTFLVVVDLWRVGGVPKFLHAIMKGPVLQVQYRLSIEKDSYFPAALQGGLTACAYLLNELRVSPDNVVLSSESAGANLVLAMIRFLIEEGKGTLPLLRAGLLWSPWVNLVPNQLVLDAHTRAKADYMKGSILEWGATLFTPPGGDRRNPYISPLLHPFKSPVPSFRKKFYMMIMWNLRKL